MFFFFKQKTAYEMRISDWSSDVCSSDLLRLGSDPDTVDGPLTLKQARFLAESKALRQALAIAAGNLSEAARVLDTSRPTLYHLLKQHDIELCARGRVRRGRAAPRRRVAGRHR